MPFADIREGRVLKHRQMRKFPSGTWVERDLFLSKAFMALSGVAPQLLIILLGKRRFINIGRKGKKQRVCDNCQELVFTYLEAKERHGLTEPRFARGIDQLLAKGFITVQHQGGALKRDKSIYGLSDNWRHWERGLVFAKRKLDPVQRGFRKPKRKTNA